MLICGLVYSDTVFVFSFVIGYRLVFSENPHDLFARADRKNFSRVIEVRFQITRFFIRKQEMGGAWNPALCRAVGGILHAAREGLSAEGLPGNAVYRSMKRNSF